METLIITFSHSNCRLSRFSLPKEIMKRSMISAPSVYAVPYSELDTVRVVLLSRSGFYLPPVVHRVVIFGYRYSYPSLHLCGVSAAQADR